MEVKKLSLRKKIHCFDYIKNVCKTMSINLNILHIFSTHYKFKKFKQDVIIILDLDQVLLLLKKILAFSSKFSKHL